MTINRFTIFLLLLVSLGSLIIGEIPLSYLLQSSIERLLGISDSWDILLDERVPRLLVLIMTGASLSCAGVIVQSVFANPLASPTVLGISGLGSLSVIAVLYAGWYLLSPLVIPTAAFLGSLLSLILLYLMSRFYPLISTSLLLLLGIAFSSIIFALQNALIFSFRNEWELFQLVSDWLSGSTYFLSWEHVILQFPLAFIGLGSCFFFLRELDLISLGDEEALHLGVDIHKARWILFTIVSFLISGSLATIGEIPFLGLMIPHIGRQLVGASHRLLIPLASLMGALFLVVLDIVVRNSLHFPLALSHLAGILGGLIFFALIIKKQRHAESY